MRNYSLVRKIWVTTIRRSAKIFESSVAISINSLASTEALCQSFSEPFSHTAVYNEINRTIQNQQKVIDICCKDKTLLVNLIVVKR